MSGASLTREAGPDDLPGLWPPVAEAHLFSDIGAFAEWWEREPWRVRVSPGGAAVIIGRWRDHLPYASIVGVWCSRPVLERLMREMVALVRLHGYERLVGPLVPEEETGPYRKAGFEEAHRIVVCRRALRGVGEEASVPWPAGLRLRPAGPTDEPGVLEVDAASFDEFWRYDASTLRKLASTSSMVVAEEAGRVIGYTLWVLRGAEGSVARLAVAPGERHRGVGRLLLGEAVTRLGRAGARAVTLTTQEENGTARRLYGREGFRESPRRLVCPISPSADAAGRHSGRE